MPLQITRQICVKDNSDYWWTVEDFHLDAGGEGVTLSYWEATTIPGQEIRKKYICFEPEVAATIAEFIHQLADPQMIPFCEKQP